MRPAVAVFYVVAAITPPCISDAYNCTRAKVRIIGALVFALSDKAEDFFVAQHGVSHIASCSVCL